MLDPQGNVYIADNLYPYQGWIWKVSGGILTLVDGIDPATAQSVGLPLESPSGLALDSKQTVYVANQMNHCILQIAGGLVSVFAGQCGSSGFGGDGGPAASAFLNEPAGVAVDPSGIVYISDSGNCKIRSVSAGVIATVVDFTPGDPRCSEPPLGIAVDSARSLYFYRPDGMYKWTSGTLTLIVGGGQASGGDGGPGTGISFQNGYGIYVDATGKIYFPYGSTIRTLMPGYSPPSPIITGVRNGTSFASGPVSAGTIATLLGNFGVASAAQGSRAPLATTLGGLTIQMQSGAGIDAPIFFTSDGQVNIQIPWELEGRSSVTFRAVLNGVPGPTQTVLLTPYSPGIFTANNQPVIFDSSGNLLGPSNPTTVGSVIQIYCTGLGPVAAPPPTGSAATVSSPTLTNPSVLIGGVPAAVLSSSLECPAYNTRMSSHQLYGLSHLLWLGGIAGTSIALSLACRRNLIPQRYVRAALICLLAGGELRRYYTDGLHFPDQLPLNLCNITAWVAVIACLTLSPIAVEFAYFAGFSGAGMALLTPDMGSVWNTRFFVNHGAIIVAASALVFGRISSLRPGAVWRAYGCFAAYIGLVGLVNWKYGANYAYLSQKPGTGTLLNFLGPWPFYILGAGAVALALFWLLWLPARSRKRAIRGEISPGSLRQAAGSSG